MLILLSPAKIQNFTPESVFSISTQPYFLNDAEILVHKVRQLSVIALSKLLDVNLDIAKINAERFSNWHKPFTTKNAKHSVLVFNGEVFHGLDVRSLAKNHHDYLQNHLRIFSGLYGVLRPLDLIQPYRIDISDSLPTEKGKDLYAYWGDLITMNINKALEITGEPRILLNLSSGEYMRSINRKKILAKIIDIEFQENHPNGYKTVIVYTKKARGMMARFVIEHQIEIPEYLKAFDSEGYLFNPDLSKGNKLVFTR